MNWEIGINIQRLPCVKQIASGNIMYSTGSSAQYCDDLEGWDRGRGRGYVYTHTQFTPWYSRNQRNYVP